MSTRRAHRLAVTAATVLLAACTGGTTETTAATTTTVPPFEVASWADESLAVIASEYPDDVEGLPIGQGVGVPLTDDGLILTSASAVLGAERVNVWLPGSEFPVAAEVLAEAACSNLALVGVDTESVPVEIDEGDPAFVVWVDDRSLRIDTYASGGATPPGAILVGDGGVVVGTSSGLEIEPSEVRGGELAELIRAMRNREVVSQLGMVVWESDDGLPVVASVDRAERPEFMTGDVITRIGDAGAGYDDLCALLGADATFEVEVFRDGRRYVGAVGEESLQVASARTQEQIREAVVRIDVDGDGDGDADTTGTGFVVSADGLIVTNYHVIAGGVEEGIQARFDTGESVGATVVGRSFCNDLALLDVAGSDHTYLEWSPDPIELEMPVRSVGFPAGTGTITFQSGQVSKELATVYVNSPLLDSFEHSAQIIAGNSGGPMLNEIGEVVGVTSSQFVFESGDNEEYALIGSGAREVVAQLGSGDYQHPGLRLDVDESSVFVDSVDAGGLADDAGLVPGDRIFRWHGLVAGADGAHEMTFRSICDRYIEQFPAMDLDLSFFRNGTEYDGDLFGSVEPIPDPFYVETETGQVGTIVPGRWVDIEEIGPEPGNDWVGFRAAPDVDSFLDAGFGSHPGMRALVSRELAEETTTREKADSEEYGNCTDLGVEAVEIRGRFLGHVRTYVDCHGTDGGIRSYALIDTFQAEPVMVLVLVAADSFDMEWAEGLVFDNLTLAEFAEVPDL